MLFRSRLPMLNHQAYAVTLLVGVRCAFDNFYQTGTLWFTNARTATVTLAAALMYALLTLALIEKRRAAREGAQKAIPPLAESKWRVIRWVQKGFRWMDANPQQLYFFVPTVLLTVLLSLEVNRSYLTASWGLEAFVLFVIAIRLGERSYRWFSLTLFLLCVGRAGVVDVWRIENPLARIVSLMGLGAALLLVSFLYARNKELFRKYL